MHATKAPTNNARVTAAPNEKLKNNKTKPLKTTKQNNKTKPLKTTKQHH